MPEPQETRPGTAEARSLMELLSPERIVIPMPGASLDEALEALRPGFGAPEGGAGTFGEEIAELEPADLVPLGEAAVLAHVRSDRVPEVRVAIGVSERPLAFAPETAPGARVLVLVVSPRGRTRTYLQTLAALGRLLRRGRVAEDLAAAGSAREVLGMPELAEPIVGPELLVRDVMTSDVVSVAPDASLPEAADRMVRRRLRALPVVNEAGEVVGLVTDREVMRHLLPRLGGGDGEGERGGEPAVPVRDVMLRSVLCVKEEERLRDVAALMIQKDVERFPVCADGILVGFLTRGDIVRRLLGGRVRGPSGGGAGPPAADASADPS